MHMPEYALVYALYTSVRIICSTIIVQVPNICLRMLYVYLCVCTGKCTVFSPYAFLCMRRYTPLRAVISTLVHCMYECVLFLCMKQCVRCSCALTI